MQDYERIVCATDFSPLGDAAAERAVTWSRRYGARLTLLHVVEYFPEDRSNEAIGPEDVDPAVYRERWAREQLRELAERLGCEEATQVVMFSPDAAWHEVVRFVGEHRTDLVVLGSHGHHGVFPLLGSTANGVVNRVTCDVLAVRPEA